MYNNYNGLTAAETERLAMLAEEAAEVIQMVGKVLRHGYSDSHPDYGVKNNRELLQAELNDLVAVICILSKSGDLISVTQEEFVRVIESRLKHTHHQNTKFLLKGEVQQ
jgi:NTP pyrophosphatase (non-canonical NTP hydrolase)